MRFVDGIPTLGVHPKMNNHSLVGFDQTCVTKCNTLVLIRFNCNQRIWKTNYNTPIYITNIYS